jgi:hypothetical protein
MQTSNLRLVRSRKVTAADIQNDPVKIYEPARGEVILAVSILSYEFTDVGYLRVAVPEASNPERGTVGPDAGSAIGSDSFLSGNPPISTPVYIDWMMEKPTEGSIVVGLLVSGK